MVAHILALTSGVAARLRGGLARLMTGSRALGQGLVEYALILVLIAVVVIGVLTVLGNQVSGVFQQVECTMGGGKQHQDNGNGNSNRCR
ncbi:MAG TPA: Flp family type IVb pilin [Roseiflexaceae bacterium]|nr:Flp family type IVb pilin [Roseiflexaceae bacterium]